MKRGRALGFVTASLMLAARVDAQQLSDPMAQVDQQPAAQTFQMTALQASHPQMFAMLADRGFGIAIKTAVLPHVFGQNSTYAASTSDRVLNRLAYAASRSVVSRGRFNVSEIGGAGISAGLSNLYHPSADRTATGTLSRWATQVLCDTVTNEIKEFWPDIRRRLHKS